MGRAIAAAIVAVVLCGCASGGDMGERPPLQTTSPLPSVTPSAGTDATPSAQQWDAILADLDARQVATTDVRMVTSRRVTWNDGSLGCPQPGQTYTQAQVPGMQVVVSAAGVEYDYRFGRSGAPRLCQPA